MLASLAFVDASNGIEVQLALGDSRGNAAKGFDFRTGETQCAKFGVLEAQDRGGFERMDASRHSVPYGIGAGNRELLSDDDSRQTGEPALATP